MLLVSSVNRPHSPIAYQFNYENVLGTSFELKVVANSEQAAIAAEEAALTEIDRLSHILSTYDPSSEVSRWQKTLNTNVPVSSELFEVLTLFDGWKVKTGGALNASAGIAVATWKKASVDQVYPSASALAGAVASMNRRHWILSDVEQTARHLTTEPLLFNSFVKSYILQKVSKQIMLLPGVTGSVVNMGGDIVVAGDREERIRVANPTADAENDAPLDILNLKGKAIATSGNYRRGFQLGEQWFSHILDVRTAIPVTGVISATVVAESATDAGALATALNILLPDESAALVSQLPGVEYMIITKDGQRIESSGWNLLQAKSSAYTVNNEKAKITNGKYELTIQLELARFEGRFRRPFVAIWVEDKKKEPVRNLALWYNKSRWLPDLKRWYSKYQSVNQSGAIESISSATRSPGRYTLTWDGLDDRGNLVPSGKYTVYIEAAREHGTYQLIKQEIDWNSKAKQLDVPGGVEITAVSLDIHPVKDK